MYFNDGRQLKGKALAIAMLHDQRRWIQYCENGRSYDGPNGPAIRKADNDALRRAEQRVAFYR